MLYKSRNLPLLLALSAALLLGGAISVWAIVTDLGLVGTLHAPEAVHADQAELKALVASSQFEKAFKTAFEKGNELFDTDFNALDGAGANVGQGQRFTRVPRADLNGPGEWANHFPSRATGPNEQACSNCHNNPSDDGAGSVATNVIRDPFHNGNLNSFIQRNTPHLFAIGAVQRLAEEMTEQLHGIRDKAKAQACKTGKPVMQPLSAKGVDFGMITVPCTGEADASKVKGFSSDLVIRPFQWKGSVAFVREFNRGASHDELGMQAVELVGFGRDGDFDGVIDELTIGDMTALAVYNAAQPRPTTKIELASLGLIDPLSPDEIKAIKRGENLFNAVGCDTCHIPILTIDNPIFSEPSQNPNYRDSLFPAGQNPVSLGVDPKFPITFDLTRDQPDNRIMDKDGKVILLGSLQKDRKGGAIVELFGDLKRHDIGHGLAESIDEVGTGASVFLTENLWGVGSTAPYLHDGRATTITEAILEHHGEAESSRENFLTLSTEKQKDIIAFLENLVLFKKESADE